DDRASTWLRPSTAFAGYSASDDRFATIRAVPSATPPSCTARSAMSSTQSSTSSLILSKSSCRAMKVGPLTFQCACLVCVCRSMQSASRALSNSITLARVPSARSFFVLNMKRLLSQDGASGRCGAGIGVQRGQQVRFYRCGARAAMFLPLAAQNDPGDSPLAQLQHQVVGFRAEHFVRRHNDGFAVLDVWLE